MPRNAPTGETIATFVAVVGDSTLYGTVFDHLLEVELHEIYHFFGHGAAAVIRILLSRSVLSFTLLCDVISAVTEFMVRVLHSRSVL